MFEFIKGVIFSKGLDYCVIEVNGIGFHISTSTQTLAILGSAGEKVTVYTYMHVKEDGISLYGFATQQELSAFLLMISVSGVGPKVALSLLSFLTCSQFGMAIVTGDFKTICKGKGVGQKLAQRIVLELKDKIKKEMNISTEDGSENLQLSNNENAVDNEAVSALMVLGYSAREAVKMVNSSYHEGMSLEETVRDALRGGGDKNG